MTDVPEALANLLTEDPRKRCYLLRALSHRPSGDPRVLPYLERLLNDRTPCILSIPLEYGEVRFQAAEALAAERGAQGIPEPVRVDAVVVPLTPHRLNRISDAEGLPPAMTWQARFERLRELGKLPLEDLHLPPMIR